MSRLMSVAKTTDAVIERRKWVTRRLGWWEDKNGRRILKPGDTLTLCKKVQGRKPGEPIVRLAEASVVDMRREPLDAITDYDVQLEGFRGDDLVAFGLERVGLLPTGAAAAAFVRFFVDAMGCAPDQEVTRIEWDYLDTPVTTIECSRPGQSYRLRDSGPVLDVHLAAGRGSGTGPCLCGFDRHAANVGFSVGGGSTGPGIHREACPACAEFAVGRPVRGLHAGLFSSDAVGASR